MPEEEVTSDPAPAVEGESAGGPAVSVRVPTASTTAPVIESPPPAAHPLKESDAEPRARLHRLAGELMRNRNRRLLVEFLQLRRALR